MLQPYRGSVSFENVLANGAIRATSMRGFVRGVVLVETVPVAEVHELSQRTPDQQITRLAASSHGVFSRAVALGAGASEGMIRERLRSGRWIIVYRGVYILAGAPRTWHQRLFAASVACGPMAAASHRAAGAMWPILGVEPGAIEISVPRGTRPRLDGVLIHQTRLPRTDVARVGATRVRTPARTLIDLAPLMPRDTLEEALDDALVRGLVTIDRMLRQINGSGSRRGIDVIRALVAARAVGAPPQSPQETRFLRLILEHGLPEPVRQYEVTDGRRRAFLDFAWPDVRLAVEVDGYRYHARRRHWENDRARLTMLTLLGWRVIHITAADLKEPETMAARVRAALALPIA